MGRTSRDRVSPTFAMHEMGIANSILDAVRTEAGRYPGTRPTKVGVRLGELAAIDPE